MAPFSKPETVLKQAEGLVSVGQTHAALQSLTEMFASKRFRSTPLASLEPIMNRFIELCVDMRKGRTAKEGLMQYKNIAQNSSVQSIESVILKFVQLADAKVREAQEKAAVKVAVDVDVDDLEASETPESILLGAVSGDQSKDRTDRALVTPWLKFLWESYRTSLETLKNNARLEDIYQKIAQQAFKFCLKHQRKVEFRRLCETLRLHLGNVAKYSHQPHSINLSDPDTLQRHLDTRFAQLNASVELELWQEAFRSVEDVHNLLTMAKKAPRPAMMANYYEKLTKIFLMSGNALFHAAAWGRYYAIVTSIGGKSEEELSRLAGQVLISALAVPVGMASEDVDGPKGRNARLAALLGLIQTPTRDGLLRDALSRNVLKISPPSVKSLYDILEVTFDPLSLCSSIAPLMKTLADEASSYQQYRALLQRAVLSRLLSQLSQVYSSIKISNLYELVAPLKDSEDAYSDVQVEAYVMGCARRGELSIHVDHATGSITFIDDPFVSSDESRAHIVPDEERVQKSSSEIVRTRLSKLATCLHNSLARIDPLPTSRSLPQEEQEGKLKSLVAAAEAERKGLQVRRALAARRRELLSELTARKEKEETSRRAENARKEKEEESKRLAQDLKRREQERLRKEVDNVRIEEAKKLAQKLTASGLKGLPLDDMENLNTDTLLSLQVEQLKKEKKESAERLRIIAKRIDHVERAYRQEERPLLARDYEQQQIMDRKTFDTNIKFRIEATKQKHAADMETKERLSRMMADYRVKREQISVARGEDFAAKQESSKKKIEDEKAKRRNAVIKEREEERAKLEEQERIEREKREEEERLEAEKRAEEDRKRQEEEAARAAEEAKKREKEEKAAAARKALEERRAAEDEQARLKLRREEEAAENARQRALESKSSKTPSTPNAPSRPEVWRRGGAPATPMRTASTLGQSETSGSKYKPPNAPGGGMGGLGASGARGGREGARETSKYSGGRPLASSRDAPRPSSPIRVTGEPAKEDDGFRKVPERSPGVWRRGGGGRV